MNRIRIPVLSWFLFLSSPLSLLAAQAPAAPATPAGPPLPAGEIVWRDASRRTAYFVSERLLNEWPWDRLAIDPERRKDLEAVVNAPLQGTRYYAPGRLYPECSTDLHTGIGEPGRQALPFLDFVRGEPLALVGRVVKVTPGWNVVYDHASSMVELRVEEVVKAESRWPAVQDRVVYEQKRGSITVKGRRLCTDANTPEAHRAAVGDLVFLSGRRDDGRDPRLISVAVWPIDGDEIEPMPYSAIADPREPVPLPRLRRILERLADSVR